MRTEFDNVSIIGNTFDDDLPDSNRAYSSYAKGRAYSIAGSFLSNYARLGRDKVLDAGCSIGAWFDFFRASGFKEIYGVDISKERLALAKKKGYIVSNVPIQKTGFENSFFDSVFMLDVLVHILQRKDRQAALKEAARVLKHDGVLIVSYAGKPYQKISGVLDFYNWFRKTKVSSNPEYMYFSSFEEIKEDLNQAGFVIKEVRGFEFLYPSLVVKCLPLLNLMDSVLGKIVPTFGRSTYIITVKPSA